MKPARNHHSDSVEARLILVTLGLSPSKCEFVTFQQFIPSVTHELYIACAALWVNEDSRS